MAEPSKKSHALRYLLLRHLWLHSESVGKKRLEETARSLAVSDNDVGFDVTWSRDGKRFTRSFSPETFAFYVRGDKAVPATLVKQIDYAKNDSASAGFALEALGLDASPSLGQTQPLIAQRPMLAFGWLLLGLVLFYAAPSELWLLSLFIPVLFALELWYPKGKLLVGLGLATLIPLGLPATGLWASVLYALMQLLDPNPWQRVWRTAVPLLSAVGMLTVSLTPTHGTNSLAIMLVPALAATLIAGTLFYARWVCGSHFRSMPLVFPLLTPALVVDGHTTLAIAVAIMAFFASVFARWGGHWIPVQRQRSLTPNG